MVDRNYHDEAETTIRNLLMKTELLEGELGSTQNIVKQLVGENSNLNRKISDLEKENEALKDVIKDFIKNKKVLRPYTLTEKARQALQQNSV